VPGKNFKSLHGKPLVRWILDSLLSIDAIDEVVINTDARAQLGDVGVVESGKVVIRDRKPHLCGDEVSMNLVLADDVEAVPADIYLMTHTTNPMLKSDTIERAIEEFLETRQHGECDSLFTVNRHQTRFYRQDVSPINHDPDNLIPTQDLEPWFEENSCLYLFTRESFASTNARIGRHPMMFETRSLESVDIDTPEDWQLAEAIANSMLVAS